MPRVAVPDTSCLIALSSLELLDLLPRFFDRVVVTPAVAAEYGDAIPPWAVLEPVSNILLVKALRTHLGHGESEVIAHTAAHPGSTAVLDDLRARSSAAELGIRVTGTLALLLRAKTEGLVSSVVDALTTLEKVGFRISNQLRTKVLDLAGED